MIQHTLLMMGVSSTSLLRNPTDEEWEQVCTVCQRINLCHPSNRGQLKIKYLFDDRDIFAFLLWRYESRIGKPDAEIVWVGKARCSKKDVFNVEKGCKIALSRACRSYLAIDVSDGSVKR